MIRSNENLNLLKKTIQKMCDVEENTIQLTIETCLLRMPLMHDENLATQNKLLCKLVLNELKSIPLKTIIYTTKNPVHFPNEKNREIDLRPPPEIKEPCLNLTPRDYFK